MYARGDGVEESEEKAFYWHKKGADQGLKMSYYNVGYAYQTGKGVKRNLKKANEWF